MKIQVRIFPIAGLCDKTEEHEIPLEDGSLNGLMARLRELLGADLSGNEKLMFLHNGYALDIEKTVFRDGDKLWLLPRLSGG